MGKKTITVGIDIQQEKARELGIASIGISNLMEAYSSGTTAPALRDRDDQIPIVVQARRANRDSLEYLRNLSIPTKRGLCARYVFKWG